MDPRHLLDRLDEIAHALEQSGHALALIGLGSVGLELERLDAYSDLDFFVIVEAGYKPAYLVDLSWLSALCPIAYHFANTSDGYKLLFEDEIFCEFAVFEAGELRGIPFAPGRVVWRRAEVPESIASPQVPPAVQPKPSQEWLLGEALTNLLVGLGREKRGEKISAARFIQGYAVDRVMDLAETIETPVGDFQDVFSIERRFERRFPETARQLPGFLQGYDRNPESALAILGFLEKHFKINQAIAAAIRGLCV